MLRVMLLLHKINQYCELAYIVAKDEKYKDDFNLIQKAFGTLLDVDAEDLESVIDKVSIKSSHDLPNAATAFAALAIQEITVIIEALVRVHRKGLVSVTLDDEDAMDILDMAKQLAAINKVLGEIIVQLYDEVNVLIY
jgi:hypothetical protein